jgi:hypothetical protein
MDPAYLCNRCLGMFERSGGVALHSIAKPSPIAKCSCGASAAHVVDLDAQAAPAAADPERAARLAEIAWTRENHAPHGCGDRIDAEFCEQELDGTCHRASCDYYGLKP